MVPFAGIASCASASVVPHLAPNMPRYSVVFPARGQLSPPPITSRLTPAVPVSPFAPVAPVPPGGPGGPGGRAGPGGPPGPAGPPPPLLQISGRSVFLHVVAMRTRPTSLETQAWMTIALDETVA